MNMAVRTEFSRELAGIQGDLMRLGSLVTQAVQAAITALATKDAALAAQVLAGDEAIDALQILIEDKTVELIALQQPIAKDLRVLSTALKMTTDLERIGDHAKKIAKIAQRIGQEPLMKPLVDIPQMAELDQQMIKDVLEAYIKQDAALALAVLKQDERVDALCTTCKRDILTYMLQDVNNIRQGTDLNKIVQRLERIGDHATNLAEWVIYLVTGHRIKN
ncbi:MAG: phosphate signaling complex protein PhoU [Acidaminococcaceae bacterium]